MKKNDKGSKNSKPRITGKIALFMALMTLGVGAKGAAIEREGTILFEPSNYFGFNYPLDTNGDMIDDCAMDLSAVTLPFDVVNRLSRYLNVGAKVIFEDEGLRPNEDFGTGRMISFTTPSGQTIRLDQMFSQEIIRQYFSYLWAKMQAEQRGGR